MLIVSHLIDRIDSATILEEPWPHMIIENIFNNETYETLLENWPSLSTMKKAPSTRIPNRYWVFLRDYKDPFWSRVGEQLASKKLKRALFSKFNLSIETSSTTEIRCMTDVKGYSIKPHIDIKYKILSMLLYTPENNDNADWGTKMGSTSSSRQFECKKAVPFIPAQALIFPNTPESLHWVDPINGGPRNQILVMYTC